MLYHVSPSAGLKTLQPRISTHGKAYVYAIENMVTGLLFGVRHDDFDFCISTDENDKPTVYECYPGAFLKIYGGKSCSVYEVDEKGFQRGLTSWSPELVSEQETSVIRETAVADLAERLLEEERNGNLKLCRYEFTKEYRKKITAHVVDRIFRFQIDLQHIMEQDERFSGSFRGIVESLQTVLDGNMLP